MFQTNTRKSQLVNNQKALSRNKVADYVATCHVMFALIMIVLAVAKTLLWDRARVELGMSLPELIICGMRTLMMFVAGVFNLAMSSSNYLYSAVLQDNLAGPEIKLRCWMTITLFGLIYWALSDALVVCVFSYIYWRVVDWPYLVPQVMLAVRLGYLTSGYWQSLCRTS